MNLLDEKFRSAVQPTTLTKKLTLNGETKAYQVYRVRLDLLYYNDQNDRIATWISQYKSEHGENAFRTLTMQQYNDVIEEFIVQSNPTSIEKTKNNIELVNQREPGVVLSDGRIVDGNRRFTCLRQLSKENPDFCWFETVILNVHMTDSKKEIKMLELAIQHGEEKKVDYNPIDRLVGVYQDIIKTGLLTVEEYAESTNETVQDVKKRVEHAQLLSEFLEYLHMPEQYYIAREYQVVTVFSDMLPALKRCKKEEYALALKEAIFNNLLMQTIGDSRKFIRNINTMMETGIFTTYIKKQIEITEKIKEKLYAVPLRNAAELKEFADDNQELAEELKNTMDLSVLRAKKRVTKSRPSQSVSKSFTMLKDVDTKIFDTLNDDEREKLMWDVARLSEKVNFIKSELTGAEIPQMISNPLAVTQEKTAAVSETSAPAAASVNSCDTKNIEAAEETQDTVLKKDFILAERHIDEPMIICLDMDKPITNLVFSLHFCLERILPFQKNRASYRLFFVNAENKVISSESEITLQSDEIASLSFTLSSAASEKEKCFLAVQSVQDSCELLQQKIPFQLSMTFTADFGF